MTDNPSYSMYRQASGRTLASGITHLLLSALAANICLFLANLAMIHAYGRSARAAGCCSTWSTYTVWRS
jgi:hypothetical protein